MTFDSKPHGTTSRKRFAWRGDAGFTLIELLVVITIISLLVAMLLPAVKIIRDASRSSVCVSNLKQLYLGVNGYALDNDGLLPIVGTILGAGGQTAGFPQIVGATYLESGKTGAGGGNGGRDVLKCPSDLRPNGSPGPSGGAMEGYNYKQCVWGNSDFQTVFTRIWSSYANGMAFTSDGNVKNPQAVASLRSTKVMFWDSVTSYSYDDNAKGLFQPLGVNRHRTGVNMVLADGSARFFDFSPLQPGDMWNLSKIATENSIVVYTGNAEVKKVGKNYGVRWWDWNAEPWK